MQVNRNVTGWLHFSRALMHGEVNSTDVVSRARSVPTVDPKRLCMEVPNSLRWRLSSAAGSDKPKKSCVEPTCAALTSVHVEPVACFFHL